MGFTTQELEMLADHDVPAHVRRKVERIEARARLDGTTFYAVPAVPEPGAYANVYEYERSMALSEFSDAYKEAHGFRPRGLAGRDFTLTEIDTMIDELYKTAF